jgi:hypothetical protein
VRGRTRGHLSAVIACALGLAALAVGLALANAAGCDWRAATAVALGCGAVGWLTGAAVAR